MERVTYKEMTMIDNDLKFEVTKIYNNIRRHTYSVCDYKLSKEEATVILAVLEQSGLLNIPIDTLESNT